MSFLLAVISLAAAAHALPTPSRAQLAPLPSLTSFFPLLASNLSGRPTFSQIVSFGDSWSDDGTGAFRLTNETWPSDLHYDGHRFTNGLTFGEQLAKGLGVSHSSLAVAGATTNNTLAQGYTGRNFAIPVKSVHEQVDTFIQSTPIRPIALYILQGGLNDFLFGQVDGMVSAKDSANSLGNAMLQLANWGAQYILLLDLPNTSPFYPYTTLNPFASAPLANFTRDFRDALYSFDMQRANVAIVDVFALFSELEDTPEIFGFAGETLGRACLEGGESVLAHTLRTVLTQQFSIAVYGEAIKVTVCNKPTSYLWWDEFNPTNLTHSYLASLAYGALKQQQWVV
ncbi:hypothetical protein JCM11641_005507 [Rhodosporidiobolus odoratus]